MRRAIARGRMFPQSYSTDRRYGRLSLKAIGIFPLMWANADDQGRLCGDPEEIKYAVCPNVDHITKTDIPTLLEELEENKLILCYDTPKSAAIQMLDWWDANQRMQWAWPSQYLPPEGWQDHLRYKKDAKTVLTQNWPISGEPSGESGTIAQVSEEEVSGESSGESSGETSKIPPLTNPHSKIERGRGERRGRGRGNSPERSGEKIPLPSPSATALQIYENMVQGYSKGWGMKPSGKATAQIRDYAEELSAAGCPESWVLEAFKEAAKANTYKLSYVRAMLLDWLGVPRGHNKTKGAEGE